MARFETRRKREKVELDGASFETRRKHKYKKHNWCAAPPVAGTAALSLTQQCQWAATPFSGLQPSATTVHTFWLVLYNCTPSNRCYSTLCASVDPWTRGARAQCAGN